MTKALILCAGHGTRLGLRKTPKCMVKINKKPVLEHLVNHLNKAGIHEIFVNIHCNYQKIFDYFGTRVVYLYEPVLLGEGGTVKMLQPYLGDDFIVMNGDTLTNVDIQAMLELHSSSKASHTYFFKQRYAGTSVMSPGRPFKTVMYDSPKAYYYDIGSPDKLARARRELKR